MSLYPIIWAAEHAPIYDAEERAILVALAIKGDFDGCNCFRGRPTLAKAARVDPKTVDRKLAAMAKRGLIRRQPGPKPAAWLKLPRDKRTVVWEVLIPCEFWSAVQLAEINEARAELGRVPITPSNRPPIADAPPKKARADKGKPNPRRSPMGKRGDSESSRSEASGGTQSPVAPGLTDQSRGDSKSTNHPLVPSDKPSSSYVTSVTEDPAVTPPAEEEGGESSSKTGTTLARAERLVDDVVAQWDARHTRPTAAERRRLVGAVDKVLAAGASDAGVVHELTRDLETARHAVAVVMTRTSVEGWAQRAPAAAPVKPARPDWCGECRESTRRLESPEDAADLGPCPTCHPDAVKVPQPRTADWEPSYGAEEYLSGF